MRIIVTITGRKKLEIPIAAGENIALYAVPKEYSDDGWYLARWRGGEIRPHPACRGDSAELWLEAHMSGDAPEITWQHEKIKEAAHAE